MSNATIYDVAGKAQVSLATVSRVLNNPDKVNESTRERVLAVIKELGYRPNAIARGLASRKTTTVGIVLSDVTRASTSQLLGGIIDIAKKYNYSVKLFSITGELDLEETIRTVVSEQVDGILFLDDELAAEQMENIRKQFSDANIPMVLTNVLLDNPEVPSVAVDYKKAAYDITKKLINAGRNDIYLLSTVRRYSVNEEKEAGYIEAMKEAGREPKVFKTSGDIQINTAHFEEYFKSNKVDAAIAKANALNKDDYKDFSGVEAAVKAVVRDKNITEQSEVDAMAKAIEDAIAALQYKDADYTKVDAAIAKANALKKDDYKDFSGVETAVKAVARGKNITEQSEVDKMAKAIEDAIAALEKKPASTKPGTSDKSPQTGDTSNLALWIALLFVSGGAAIGTTVVSRKKKYNR